MENHLIISIKSYIKENIYKPFRILELCKTLGYSKSYLSKIFQSQTGNTIANYATETKVKKAKQMIRDGQYNFSEISDILSFDNPQYFSRVFKHVTNMTPTEFKLSLNFQAQKMPPTNTYYSYAPIGGINFFNYLLSIIAQ